jgi:[ribosomal protein S5]-alanine N-acetyltransferase
MPTMSIQLTDDLVLRPIAEEDSAALTRGYVRNREHIAPYEPIRPEAFYTERWHADQYKRFEEDRRAGRTERWLVADGAGEIYGSVTMSGIEYGAFLNARLGYWVDGSLGGLGIATKSVTAICGFARDGLKLHRLEASTLVDNVRSQRVLLKCGFEQIGMSPQHLNIWGEWRDHNLYHRILHTNPV